VTKTRDPSTFTSSPFFSLPNDWFKYALTCEAVRIRFKGLQATSGPNDKWWTLSCTSLGVLLVTINSGTLIIALPDLQRALGTGLLQLVWVILAYLISSTVLVLTGGRLSDLFGRKKGYLGAFALFGLASLGAGFSVDGTQLILWRVLQGVGGALVFANAPALVTDAFPREQLGLAMGTNAMIGAIGLLVGPVLGGALVTISWQWVFWFNVPLALVGGIWGTVVLRDPSERDCERGLDPIGTIAFVAGLTGLAYGISRGGLSGWDDTLTVAGLIVGVTLLPLFILIESRVKSPMLDLSLFGNRLVAAATAAAFINGLARFALMFIFVFYFQGAQGDDPILAGIKLAPMAFGMLVASPIAGIWADRHGSRLLASTGMLVTAFGLALMTTLGSTSPYWHAAIYLGLTGIGSGVFMSPNTAAMMGTVETSRRGIAAGVRTMAQNIGAVISIALVLAIITAAIPQSVLFKIFSGLATGLHPTQLDPFINNMHTALWILTGISLVGAVVSLLRPTDDAGTPGTRPDASMVAEAIREEIEATP